MLGLGPQLTGPLLHRRELGEVFGRNHPFVEQLVQREIHPAGALVLFSFPFAFSSSSSLSFLLSSPFSLFLLPFPLLLLLSLTPRSSTGRRRMERQKSKYPQVQMPDNLVLEPLFLGEVVAAGMLLFQPFLGGLHGTRCSQQNLSWEITETNGKIPATRSDLALGRPSHGQCPAATAHRPPWC